MPTKTSAAERARPVVEPGSLVLLCLTAWAVPGAGHFWLGRKQKALVFFVALGAMFATGLLLDGRLAAFDLRDPLAALEAIANAGMGLPWLITKIAGWGPGTVTALTYEYGNTFLIVAGLLNFLVILDAFDYAAGRK